LRQPVDRNLTPLQNIFKNRGMIYDKDSMLTYIYPPATVLYELTSIENLREGASMLMKHIKNEDNVLLVVDEDCDGYTSSAFFLN
jgi:hypothetical protein